MQVVSTRVSDEVEATLRKANLVPSQVAREALEAKARELRAKEAFERLRRNSFTPVEPSLKTIRDIRDNE